MRLLLLIGALLLTTAFHSDEDDVRAAIDQLFDGMRLGDTTMVGQVFAPEAIIGSIGRSNNPDIVVHTPAKIFVTNIGKPRTDVWDERIDHVEIKVDGNMASAWVPYAFYIGDSFSHCGVNSIQLAKVDGSWKITYIIDTRRKDNCIVN